jgi:hypothetical protein
MPLCCCVAVQIKGFVKDKFGGDDLTFMVRQLLGCCGWGSFWALSLAPKYLSGPGGSALLLAFLLGIEISRLLATLV